MDDWVLDPARTRPARALIYTLAVHAALARQACSLRPVCSAFQSITTTQASLPLVRRRFGPWTDHPRAACVAGQPHVLDASQQTRAKPAEPAEPTPHHGGCACDDSPVRSQHRRPACTAIRAAMQAQRPRCFARPGCVSVCLCVWVWVCVHCGVDAGRATSAGIHRWSSPAALTYSTLDTSKAPSDLSVPPPPRP